MLRVTKILEGGIDLETRTELPRVVVISNGKREVHIPVNDNVIREVVALYAENGGEDRGMLVPQSKGTPQPRRNLPSPRAQATAITATVPSNLFEEEEGFEPGEEFDDPDTGVGSL